MYTCSQCSSAFDIAPMEQKFLEKVQMPAPTLCPLCRRQNRFAWRNERKLYHRKCDLTGKQIISMYAPDSEYTVYDQHEWHTDKWDGMDAGRDFDFSRPFFDQFGELMKATPKISIFMSQNDNSDFTNGTQQDKNCYMIFVSDHNEDCYFSYGIDSCQDCMECLNCYKCTLCIECIDCSEGYNLAYCERSHNSRDSFFLSDCKNCQDCFGCFGLRGKQYHIFNQPHSKEEYEAKLAELNTGNRSSLEAAKDVFEKQRAQQHVFQYYDGNNNENVTGDHIVNCRNCIDCYDSGDLQDCGHLIFSFKSKDCFDGHVVVDNCELCYGTISTINQYNTQFTFVSFFSKDSMYLDHCLNCKDCFGCSGLRGQQYCIFNKQYSKEEYEQRKARIIEHMKKSGEWGQHLPPQLSPFGYNETIAQEYFPLSKEEVTKHGWKWQPDTEGDTSAYQGPTAKAPDTIQDVTDELTEQILLCAKSGKPYKLIKQEIERYRSHNLPVPNVCFDERHIARIARRNPRKLWNRECAKCNKQLQSSYAPERPDTIYCEECYINEVN